MKRLEFSILIIIALIFVGCTSIKVDESEEAFLNTPPLFYSAEVCVAQDIECFTIDLFGEDERVTDLRISAGNQLFQEISIEYHIGPINETYGFYSEDYNFDGYQDIRLQQMGGSGANTVFTYWLWNNELMLFEHNADLSALTAVTFYIDEEQLVSENSSSAGTLYTEEVYKFVSNDLVQVKLLVKEWTQELELFVYRFYEYIDDRQELVGELTADLSIDQGFEYEHFRGTGIWKVTDLAGSE